MTGLKNIIRSMKGNGGLYSSLLLHTIIVMILIATISAELFQNNKDAIDSVKVPSNKNQVTSYDDCKKYLCKYGYLKCDCQAHLMRKKRQLEALLHPTEYNGEQETTDPPKPTVSDKPNNHTSVICLEQDFVTGLITFQKNYRIEASGVCDRRTTDLMSQRRCGQPDTVIDKLDSDVVAAPAPTNRYSRSLTEIIRQNTEYEQVVERRKQQLQDYLQEIKDEKATPKTEENGKTRHVRSAVLAMTTTDDYGGLLSKSEVNWRLMNEHYSAHMEPDIQRSILKQAFRYWSEVAPLCFREKLDSYTPVDIEIGFLEGVHLSCFRQFDGFGGEIAHKYIRDVHFDNSEPYTTEVATTNSQYISLLLVAVHELGHVMGLNHSDITESVMHAMYHNRNKEKLELSSHDLQEVRKAYGPCSGRFDVAFDWVTTIPGTRNSRRYSTYFFRDDHYWMYRNNLKRPRHGDPLRIQPQWDGLPTNIDAFMHYWEFSVTSMAFHDEYYFFKGNRYYKYDVTSDTVVETDLTVNKFANTNSTFSLPTKFDTVYYDYRVKLIYFVRGSQVFSYNYTLANPNSCCSSISNIVDVFPPASPAELRAPDGTTYARDIDTIYFSNSYNHMFIIKGEHVWRNEINAQTSQSNSMKYWGKWYDLWEFICDGECS